MKEVGEWPAASVEIRMISSLIPDERNTRTHSESQVEQLAASMREWGWTNPVLVDETGMIIAGHGRVLAAQKLGLADAPVMTARGWTPAQKQAYAIADNKLALNAGWDMEKLAVGLADLQGVGFDLRLVGFSDKEFDKMFEQEKEPNVEPRLNGLSYAVIIRCKDEDDQLRVLEQMEQQGLKCEALIS